MSPAVALPLAVVAAYLVGSVDFAVIVGRMYGVDIHQEGSGNPGMSNVLRDTVPMRTGISFRAESAPNALWARQENRAERKTITIQNDLPIDPSSLR